MVQSVVDPKTYDLIDKNVSKVDQVQLVLQAAATTTVFTASTDVQVETLIFRTARNASADPLPFTGISVQTNDVTPLVLIPNTAAGGRKANLTQDAQIAWGVTAGPLYLRAGFLIQVTVNGGAMAAPTTCDFLVKYRYVATGKI